LNGSGPPTPRPPLTTVEASSTPSSPGGFDDFVLDPDGVRLARGLREFDDLAARRAGHGLEGVGADGRDAVVALEGAGRDR
jgi:hypothetical protein